MKRRKTLTNAVYTACAFLSVATFGFIWFQFLLAVLAW
jgi:hypothetical protein